MNPQPDPSLRAVSVASIQENEHALGSVTIVFDDGSVWDLGFGDNGRRWTCIHPAPPPLTVVVSIKRGVVDPETGDEIDVAKGADGSMLKRVAGCTGWVPANPAPAPAEDGGAG